MKIAYCNAIREFHGNRLADAAWASRFPGTSWVSVLHGRARAGGFEIASGDVALEHVRRGDWHASDVHVLQELDAPHGRELCRRGARPTLLMSFESPVVAFRNFDRLRRSSAPFVNIMGPELLLAGTVDARSAVRHAMTFPSFWRDSTTVETSVVREEGVVLVAANKYWREPHRKSWRDPKSGLRLLRRAMRRALSPTFGACKVAQLHDERLSVIERLSRRECLDIWGPGWESLDNLPDQWISRIQGSAPRIHGPCESKTTILRRFRFALAYENASCDGYVTEKIIDAMHAGCIPVYRGAPDILKFVPQESFVDGRGLADADDPIQWLRDRVGSDGEAMRDAARRFLASPRGQRHSFEGFASWILGLCGVPDGGAA